jgi:hypothetical protein
MNLSLILFSTSFIECFIEVTMNSAQAMIPNDYKCANFDNLRLKTTTKLAIILWVHLMFVKLGNEYEVEVSREIETKA